MRSTHQLIFQPLSVDSWRLCDHRVGRGDIGHVIAFVQLRRDGAYEVIWLTGLVGPRVFRTTAELIEAAELLLDRPVGRGSTKPVPIAHRHPPVTRRTA